MAQLVVSNEAVALAKETAELSIRPEFLNIVEKVALFETGIKEVRVICDVTEKQAVTSLGMVKGTTKDLEKMRKGIVAFPNKWVKTVNNMFGGLKKSLDSVSFLLDGEVLKYRAAKRVEIEKAQALVDAVAKDMVIPVKGLEGIPDEPGLPVTPPLPEVLEMSNITKGEDGSASYEKDVFQVTIFDPIKLVKAALDKRVSKIPFDVIAIQEGVVKKLVQDGAMTAKKWKQYGVEVVIEKKLITRTG